MTPRARRVPDAWIVAGLVLLVAGVFANTLRGGFVLDDHFLIERNPRAAWPAGLGNALTLDVGSFSGRPTAHAYYRPLVLASFVVDRALWGARAGPYHAQNLLWHALATLLAFLVLARLGLPRAAAAAAAALWAVHPIATECVAWISGRTDPMAACGILGALLALLAFVESGSAAALAAAALATLLGCLAKETAVLVPALALLASRVPGDLARHGGAVAAPAGPTRRPRMAGGDPDARARGRRAWRGAALLVAPVALALVTRALVTGGGWRTAAAVHGRGVAARIALRSVGFYLRALLWPSALPGDIHVAPPAPAAVGVVLGAGVAFAALAGLAWAWRRGARAAPLLTMALVSMLLTSGLVIPLIVPVAVRYLYLPSLWLWAALADAFRHARRPAWLAPACAGALVLLLAPLTVRHNADYRDDAAFYPAVIRSAAAAGVEPGYYALENYGHLLADQGRLGDAERVTRRAIAEEPEWTLAWTNLGNILALGNDVEGALAAWRRALELDPAGVDPRVNSAVTLDRAGRRDEALAAYRAALARPLDAARRAAIAARVAELAAVPTR